MVPQVEGAEHLPAAQHVALHYLLEGPGILVVLLHLSMHVHHGCMALSVHHLN